MSHSLFGGSSLERRELCPGSYAAERGIISDIEYRDEGGADAQRGTACHIFVGSIIRGLDVDVPFDMADDVAFAVQETREIIGKHKAQFEYVLRDSFNPDWGIEETTIDCLSSIGSGKRRCFIIDYKFGHNAVTQAIQNLQLALYALGVHKKFGAKIINAWIVQPPLKKVDVAEFSEWDEIERRIERIIERAREPNAPRVPGVGQCRYCKAAGSCPALASIGSQLSIAKPVHELALAEKGKLLDLAELVENWVKRLKESAYLDLCAGRNIDGWGLAPGRKSRSWGENGERELRAVAEKLGRDPNSVVERCVASPATIERLWGRGADVRECLGPLITESLGKPRMVREKEADKTLVLQAPPVVFGNGSEVQK